MITALLCLGLLAIAVGMAWVAGKLTAKTGFAEDSLKVKDDQLKEGTKRPSQSELVDRLRDGKF